jgi:hypothetical protein
MSPQTDVDKTTIARIAASRAQALRLHAESVVSESLAPLRSALLIRAGELDLAAAVLDEPAPLATSA